MLLLMAYPQLVPPNKICLTACSMQPDDDSWTQPRDQTLFTRSDGYIRSWQMPFLDAWLPGTALVTALFVREGYAYLLDLVVFDADKEADEYSCHRYLSRRQSSKTVPSIEGPCPIPREPKLNPANHHLRLQVLCDRANASEDHLFLQWLSIMVVTSAQPRPAPDSPTRPPTLASVVLPG